MQKPYVSPQLKDPKGFSDDLALLDLWAMLERYGYIFCSIGTLLGKLTVASSEKPLDIPMDPMDVETIRGFLVDIARQSEMVRLVSTRAKIRRTLDWISPGITTAQLALRLGVLNETLEDELKRRHFLYLSPARLRLYEREKLFGEEVYAHFPEATSDIKDAGTCLATSLPTAGVFHLMRVAEYGLRRLAKKLRVRVFDKGRVTPLEYADWNKVITGAKNKIQAARALPAGRHKQEKLEAYSNIADHCEYMKDIWRNNTAHARKRYSEAEALAVLERVREFMRFVAQYVA